PSHIDRFTFINNSEHLNVELLIKNFKNVIMKKLSMLYITKSSIFFSVFSISFSVTLSQSSTPVSVSDSLTSATSVPVILTLTTSALSDSVISAFIISSSHFKKILCRLNESYFSRITSLFNSVKIIKNIHIFRNENTDIVLFYTYRYKAHTLCLKCYHENELFVYCILLPAFLCILLCLSEKPCVCFTLTSEIILIEDDYVTETILFYSQASLITFSLFSAEKVVCISDHKHSAL
ncbi:hypothetical protein BDBG_17898, partial [Blastomyces gilchristii SLH14081]